MPPDDLPAEEPHIPPEVLERLRQFVEREAQQRQARPPAGTAPPCGCGLLRQPDPNAPPPRVIYRTTLGEIAGRTDLKFTQGPQKLVAVDQADGLALGPILRGSGEA